MLLETEGIMDFPNALNACLEGSRITNENWNGKGMYIEVIPGCRNMFNEMMLPFLEMTNANGEKVPWVPSTGDLFSKRWKIIEG